MRPGSPEQRARLTLFVVGDAAIAWGCLALTVFIRRNIDFTWTQSVLPPEKFPLDRFNVPLFIVALILSLALNGFYNLRVSRRQRPILAAALLMQLALAAVGGVVLQRAYPRTILFAVPFLEAVAIPAWRRLARLIVPVRARDTVIVAEPEDAREFLESIEKSGDARINVVGVVSNHKPQCGSVEYWGRIDDPEVRLRIAGAEEAVYVAHDADPSLRLKLLALRGAPGFLMVPSQADTLLTSATFGWMGDQPLVEIAARGAYGVGGFLKRTFDILIASILLILAFPLALLISLVILLDSGLPILIRQQRAGKDGEPFEMWKFRTMFNDHAAADLLDLARENDARVTRSGVWLRRHRLDELPQLLNVLSGDMSLVGPRPERPEIMQLLATKVPNFDLRLMVRPGLAGLAQVSAEYDTQPAVKLRYDLTYICAWSMALDVRILLRAVTTALSGRGL